MIKLAVPLLALTFAAGCSGGSKGDEVATAGGNQAAVASPSASASVDREEQLRVAVQCLRDHGLDLPDPEPGAVGGGGVLQALANVDRTKLASALEACRDKLPNGGQPPRLDQAQLDQLRVFAQCMRDHHVDVPDPDPNQVALGLLRNGSFDLNSPTFQAAFTACRDKLPNFRPSASPSVGG